MDTVIVAWGKIDRGKTPISKIISGFNLPLNSFLKEPQTKKWKNKQELIAELSNCIVHDKAFPQKIELNNIKITSWKG